MTVPRPIGGFDLTHLDEAEDTALLRLARGGQNLFE
jgi:hypothetical protein